jgi:hypothetical protein
LRLPRSWRLELEIVSQSSVATRGLTNTQYTSDSAGVVEIFRKARGSLSSPSAVSNSDYIGVSNYEAYDGSEFLSGVAGFGARVNGSVATGSVPTDLFFWTSGGGIDNNPYTNGHVRMVVSSTGNVGIGTTSPQQSLDVHGTIAAQEVIVTTSGADYVFGPDYRLPSLTEVAAYISDHHHLPDIPSAAEMKEKGVGVADMQAKLLAKIEELTLHMIQAEERNSRMEQENQDLKETIQRIQERIGQ